MCAQTLTGGPVRVVVVVTSIDAAGITVVRTSGARHDYRNDSRVIGRIRVLLVDDRNRPRAAFVVVKSSRGVVKRYFR
jgi:hypothetical protein